MKPSVTIRKAGPLNSDIAPYLFVKNEDESHDLSAENMIEFYMNNT
jgi:hypothetical protein